MLAVLLLCGAQHAARANPPAPIALLLNAPRSARFAGYYTALALGYYAAAGLDVALRPAPSAVEGPLAAPPPHAGLVVWSATLPQALRSPGRDLVNFAQIMPHSGLELVCRKAGGLHAPIDFAGKTLGIWQDASAPILAWLTRLKLDAPGAVHVRFIPHGEGAAAAAPLLNGQVDCIEAQSFDQYFDIVDANPSAAALQVFHLADAGTATLADGLYAARETLADQAQAAVLVRFLRASLKGWRFAVAHQPEAAGLLAKRHATTAERARLLQSLAAIAPLTASGLQNPGYLEPAAYNRTLQILGMTPSQAGWTHAIWSAQ